MDDSRLLFVSLSLERSFLAESEVREMSADLVLKGMYFEAALARVLLRLLFFVSPCYIQLLITFLSSILGVFADCSQIVRLLVWFSLILSPPNHLLNTYKLAFVFMLLRSVQVRGMLATYLLHLVVSQCQFTHCPLLCKT